MNNNTHHIDNIYKSRFESFEPEVSDKVWNNIREDLINKKKKKIVVFIRYGIAASVAVLLSLGAFFLFDNDNNVPLTVNNQQTQQIKSDDFISNQTVKSNAIVQNENDLNTDNENTFKNLNSQITEPEHIKTKNIEEIQYANEENRNPDNKSFDNNAIVSVQTVQKSIYSENKPTIEVAQNSKTEDKNEIYSDENAIAASDNINIEGDKLLQDKTLKNNILTPLVDSSTNDIEIAENSGNDSTQIAANEYNNNIQTEENKRQNIDSIFSIDLTDQQLIAQNEIAYTDVNNKTIWAVGGQFSPVYTLNQEFVYGSEYSKDAAPVYENTTYMNNASQPEPKAEMSYSGGLMVKMQKGGRFSIRTGVYYSNKKQSISDVPILNTVQQNSSSFKTEIENVSVEFQGENNKILNNYRDKKFAGYSAEMESKLANIPNPDRNSPDSPEEIASSNSVENPMQLQINLKQEVEYIEVPLILEYKLIDQRMDLHVHGGINTGFLVVNSAQMELDNTDFWKGKTNDMNKVIYSASFGFGLGYDVSKKVSLNFEPTLKYGLSNINKDKTVFDHPYSLGFFTGVSYNF